MTDSAKSTTTYSVLDTTKLAPGERLLAATLAGIANRRGPRLYLVLDRNRDEHWIDWYCEYGLQPQTITLPEALSTFSAACPGVAVTSFAEPFTVPLGASMASAFDLLTTDRETFDKHASNLPPLKEDLTGRWPQRIDGCRWAWDNVYQRCGTEAIASVLVGSGPEGFRPLMFDLAVARRAVVHDLSVNDVDCPQEAQLCHQLLSRVKPLGLALGWSTEHDVEATYVAACSQHGLVQICSSGASNLSFHQHVSAREPFRQDHRRPEDVALDRGGVYITLCCSDGDALHSMVNLQQGHWKSHLRGSFPFAWQVAPRLAADLGPALLEYYYKTLTPNEYIVAGPSGSGYVYPSVMPNLPDFLELTRQDLALTDLRVVWPINRVVRRLPGDRVAHRTARGEAEIPIAGGAVAEDIKNEWGADYLDPDVVAAYVSALPECFGFIQGFEPLPGAAEMLVDGIPWLPTAVMATSPRQALQKVESLAASRTRPVFVPIHVSMCSEMNRGAMWKTKSLVDAFLSRGYRVVRPDELLLARRLLAQTA